MQIVTKVIVPATAVLSSGQDPYDLVALPIVKDDIGVSDTGTDLFLLRSISRASSEIAKFCSRTFQVETVLDRIYPARDTVPYSVLAPQRVPDLALSRSPIASAPCTAGLAAPVAPMLASVVSGALAAARYYVEVTYVTAAGETAVSTESALSVGANAVLQVASPAANVLATGWNVYVASASGAETRQNAAPIAIGTPWTQPNSGLIAGAAPPSCVAVVENAVPLAEGIDFLVKYDFGQLVRLDTNARPRLWPSLPIAAQYQAGFATIPFDVQEGASLLVKRSYYARGRDPMLRQENVVGVYEASWWLGAGPSSATGNMPPDVSAMIEKYRAPVIA
jgi:hypothetical protein